MKKIICFVLVVVMCMTIGLYKSWKDISVRPILSASVVERPMNWEVRKYNADE